MINKNSLVCGGSPTINNTRIPVWLIIKYLQCDMNITNILNNYPSISENDLFDAINYYENNQSEIDFEIFLNK